MFQSNGQNSIIVVGDGDGFVHASAQYSRLMHEITFSSNDEPKILSRLTCSLSEIGLNIQETCLFHSGWLHLRCLCCDGWPYEET